MSKLEGILTIAALCLISLLLGLLVSDQPNRVQAQSGTWSFSVASPHTSCPTVITTPAPVTQFCYASDGLWWSNQGAAWAPVGTGVTQITVNGGTPQTGQVALVIPSKATTTLQ